MMVVPGVARFTASWIVFTGSDCEPEPVSLPPGVKGGFVNLGLIGAVTPPPLYRQRQGEPFWFTHLSDSQTIYVNWRSYNSLGAKLRSSDLALAQITAKWNGSLALFNAYQADVATRADQTLKSGTYTGSAKTVEEFLRESIVNPDAVASKKYRGPDGRSKMPAFNEDMTVQELIDISTYLASLKPKGVAKSVSGEGKVIAVVPESQEIIVEHGDIKGFMDAMTMGYRVDPPSLLATVNPGDKIRFTIDVDGVKITLTNAHHSTSASHATIKPARMTKSCSAFTVSTR